MSEKSVKAFMEDQEIRIKSLESERDALKAEVSRLIGCWTEIDKLKAEHGVCSLIEKERDRLKASNARLREALEKISQEGSDERGTWIAQEALKENEA